MGQEEFRDAALVLLGHGSTRNAGAGTPAFQHAAELRRRRCFAEVREAFWKQEPDLARALSGLTAPRVFLVPLFVSEGYFSEEIIPQALGVRIPGQATWTRVQRRGPQTLFYCKPVGTHEHMTGVLLARAREAVAQYPFRRAPEPSEITLFIAGHGTGENEGSRQAIERQAELIRGQGIYADVHAVFLEEAPRIGACYALAQTRHLVVVPFFISDGCTCGRISQYCWANRNAQCGSGCNPDGPPGAIPLKNTASWFGMPRAWEPSRCWRM